MRRSLPPLRLLVVFETVLRTGGVRSAAAELNVSQPAISQSLRQLEDYIGAKLLDRASRPAGLTEAGRRLHRATSDGLGRIARTVEDIQRLSASAEASVTVACSFGVATYWLMPRLASLQEHHPKIAVSVKTTPLGVPAISPDVDIAIRYGNGNWTDGEVHLLFPEEIDPVCSPILAERIGGADGLDSAPLIHVDVEEESWSNWPNYLAAIGRPAGGPRPGLHFTNYVQTTQATLAHQGIMLGWRSVSGDLLAEGSLVKLLRMPVIPRDAFYLVIAPRRTSHSCEAVVSWLLKATEAERAGAPAIAP